LVTKVAAAFRRLPCSDSTDLLSWRIFDTWCHVLLKGVDKVELRVLIRSARVRGVVQEEAVGRLGQGAPTEAIRCLLLEVGRLHTISFVLCHVIHGLLRQVERLEIFVSGALASIDQVRDTLLRKLVLLTNAAVLSDELLNGEVATSDTNHDRLTLDLHEDLLAGEAIDAWCFSLKMHLTAEAQRRFVDVVGQVAIDRVILQGLINEKLVFNGALHVFHLFLKPLNLLVPHLAPSQQLKSDRLSLLKPLFDLEQSGGALVVLGIQVGLQLCLLAQSRRHGGNASLLVLLRAQELLNLRKVAVDSQIFPRQLLDDLIFALDVLQESLVLILDRQFILE